MDSPDTEVIENNNSTPPMLFNDVFFRPAPCDNPGSTWAPFPRLPPELRLDIWLLYLRQHRMIEVDLRPAATDDPDARQIYTDRNHLGRIVSGRRYTFSIRGPGPYTAFLSCILRVNHEAREAARSFYHIHLPLHAGGVFYLSPEYDVVFVRPRDPMAALRRSADSHPYFGFETIFVDFLHDARAYDYKDQGYN